jgi:hypothetical protein
MAGGTAIFLRMLLIVVRPYNFMNVIIMDKVLAEDPVPNNLAIAPSISLMYHIYNHFYPTYIYITYIIPCCSPPFLPTLLIIHFTILLLPPRKKNFFSPNYETNCINTINYHLYLYFLCHFSIFTIIIYDNNCYNNYHCL